MTLITDEYRSQIRTLHATTGWGKVGHQFADAVAALVAREGLSDILDYGCGKGRMSAALKERGLSCTNYDPAIEEFSSRPEPHDLVTCFDVLEHIEPDLLDNVLEDLRRVTRKLGMFTIATRPAQKTLPDGRNAHLIIEKKDWWLQRLDPYFRLVAEPSGDERQFVVFVRPR